MAYVITDTCIKDSLCVEVCPADCIHPQQDEPGFEAATQISVDPEGCIDCGAHAFPLAPPTRSMRWKMSLKRRRISSRKTLPITSSSDRPFAVAGPRTVEVSTSPLRLPITRARGYSYLKATMGLTRIARLAGM